jgi:hypothetical protein
LSDQVETKPKPAQDFLTSTESVLENDTGNDSAGMKASGTNSTVL